MLVRHFCYYLTDWNGISPRKEDYDSNKVVKCLKNETVKGYADISLGGATIRLNETSKQEFLRRMWIQFGKVLHDHLAARTAIVPIPSREGFVGAPPTYRTLQYVQAIAATSSEKIIAVDALRWKQAAEPAHKQKGVRTPERRYENLTVIECPQIPIILFDDVITSGSSFVAACWRLAEAGNMPTEGFVVARRTPNQEAKMFGAEQRDLEIPPRPMS